MSSSHPQHLSSPVEEDISHADNWTNGYANDTDNDIDNFEDSSAAAKASAFLAAKKLKARAWSASDPALEGTDENDMLEPADNDTADLNPPDEYPPSKEEEAETRRVEEVSQVFLASSPLLHLDVRVAHQLPFPSLQSGL